MYIFHHIPKTAGQSINSVLKKWFDLIKDYRPEWERDGVYFNNRLNLNNLPRHTCLCGHFEIEKNYLHIRYPEVLNNDKFKIFTFVRNPLEIGVSLYYYEKKAGFNKDVTLEGHLLRRMNNYLAHIFPCSEENYKEILSRYFFIGITELSQKSIDRLADIIDKPRMILPIENKSERDKQFSSLSESTIQEFKVNNGLDYLIYEYCFKQFNSYEK